MCGNPIDGMGLKARIGKRPPYRLLRKAGRFVGRGERPSVQRSPKAENLRKHRRPTRPRRLQGFKHEGGPTLAGDKTVTGLVKGAGRFRRHGVPAERMGFGIPKHPAAGKAGIPGRAKYGFRKAVPHAPEALPYSLQRGRARRPDHEALPVDIEKTRQRGVSGIRQPTQEP